MALALPDPKLAAKPPRWAGLRHWLASRGWELPWMLGIAAVLAYDRYRLCKQYLFQYTDEDQSCMWYAAHELLHGRIAEPCFYGQDYNCCLEGYLAAPLVALHVPYNIACPLVTVLLGLLPFLLLALVAWRRSYFIAAAAALLLPLMLPVRYGIISGIPRGFINGIAVASLPLILLLPPHKRNPRAAGRVPCPAGPPNPILTKGPPAPLGMSSADTPADARTMEATLSPRARQSWLRAALPALQYFLAGALAVIAFQVNPNCTILLVPVAVYAILTRGLQWKFWVFGLLGLAAAAPYPYYVHQFYHVYHPDYVLYLRGIDYRWGWSYYHSYLNFIAPKVGPSPVLADLVPLPITGTEAPTFLLYVFIAITLLLAVRLRMAAVLAALAALGIVFISFAYERVHVGELSNTASYSYSRMYLALPVVLAWLFFLASRQPWRWLMRPALARWTPWIVRTVLAGLFGVALYYGHLKEQALPLEINRELRTPGFVICPPVPVGQLFATLAEIKKVADAQHADLVIVGGGDKEKNVAYALPALYGIATLFPDFERRTSRIIEEKHATHGPILLLGFNASGATAVGGGTLATLDADGHVIDTPTSSAPRSTQRGHSFIIPQIRMIDAAGMGIYDLPQLAARMPRFYTPRPTAENPHPASQVYRPPWPH